MKICVIPARGGSKRIPRKNIKLFHGKPMLAYPIEAALKSGLFDQIYVSTEDDEIADIALDLGAQVIRRKPELADDYTTTVAVMIDAINELGLNDVEHSEKLLTCLYPCVPFLQVSDLQLAMEELLKNKPSSGFVFPVAEFPSAIQCALTKNEQHQMRPIIEGNTSVRTQDLELAFYDVGQFYIGRLSSWLSGKSPHIGGLGLTIPSWRVVDIDTPEDWQRAELIYRALFLQEAK